MPFNEDASAIIISYSIASSKVRELLEKYPNKIYIADEAHFLKDDKS